ncbi:MAG: type II toxin-antitoxin system HicA family toxin [Chitinophagaceae bacterium]|jgi:predicted RNA binding protein YcfA (HicA-like mRNA interferase family)|nr:type II toxin-antitoxin system HicA family toxin [Chitinophagaceae bacterium]
MKSSEFLRLLRRHGCYFVRQGKGSHEIWFSSVTQKEFPVPNHGSQEIGLGLERKIKKLAGIK